jgi:quinol-cytochrome oxidoreductase complex cytochrome b subunit
MAVDRGLAATLRSVVRTPVAPERRGRVALGWWILILFGVQIVTGTLLSFYYEASPDMAAESVRYVMRDVGFGWLMRGLHAWSSHGMIALGLAQMARVLFAGTYRGAGAASWYLGVALLFLVGMFAFTGGLLPWDDAAHGAATRSLALLDAAPGVGPWLATVLRGGEEVASATLSRAYSAHVLLLPWLTFFLVLVNLWFLAHRRATERELT